MLKYTIVSDPTKVNLSFCWKYPVWGPISKTMVFRKYLYIRGPAIASKPLNVFDTIHTNTVF